MRAVIINPKKNNSLEIADIQIPEPKIDEVRMKVISAGVNRPDILQKKGLYPPPVGSSTRLGLEASGIIEKIGKNVKALKEGDKVCGLTPGGAYADSVVLPASHCFPIPKGLDFYEAASLPETYMTAWVNLFEHGRLSRGERVLIHGGSSGVGTAAIQLARWRKSSIFCTVRNKKKAIYCKSLGAEETIVYLLEDFEEKILECTNKLGVNVILDMVGGEYISKNLNCLSHRGRLVQIAFLKGSKTNLNLFQIMLKQQIITGSTLRSRSNAEKERIVNVLKQNIWPEIESGNIKTKVHEIFKLEDAELAHKKMELSDHCGKIVLKVNEP